MTNPAEGHFYAEVGGVNYDILQSFKDEMCRVATQTLACAPMIDGQQVRVESLAHGAYWELGQGVGGCVSTLEGLGNETWPAEVMYTRDPGRGSRYGCVARDLFAMGINDNAAHGARPFLASDEVSAGTSEWFGDVSRAHEFAMGILAVCQEEGIVLGSGESPVYKYLIRSRTPVADAPVMSIHITGYVAPGRLVRCDQVEPGVAMVGFNSSGVHCNGIAAILGISEELQDGLLTSLPSGQTLGDALLTPTMLYSQLTQAILNAGVTVHAFLPVTGHGVGKMAFSKQELTYFINSWPVINPDGIFQFLRRHIPDYDMLTIFNMGIGYVAFVSPEEADATLCAGQDAGYRGMIIGHVEEGKRGTVFGPWGELWLDPPGE